MRRGILCFITTEKKILLIQVDYGDSKILWNGVSGFIDDGESPEDAVIREVKEEIGITIEKNTIEYKGTRTVSENLELEIFTAKHWSGTPEPKEESIRKVQWFERENLPFDQMFENNKDWINDLRI